ncbi:hypothetical protein CKAN_01513200 [Cinnamomum micranthum f. kanehirae]|uniref:Uncharacterized protein n=1 Tax=Cinnamomum micranthum f. kanehirae TaxID=337451 RepID=A0A443P631_9MAGN|nr:hypothetical protein CKAN_01513200 [Cinnamomum micranthum f. kanehirae]
MTQFGIVIIKDKEARAPGNVANVFVTARQPSLPVLPDLVQSFPFCLRFLGPIHARLPSSRTCIHVISIHSPSFLLCFSLFLKRLFIIFFFYSVIAVAFRNSIVHWYSNTLDTPTAISFDFPSRREDELVAFLSHFLLFFQTWLKRS